MYYTFLLPSSSLFAWTRVPRSYVVPKRQPVRSNGLLSFAQGRFTREIIRANVRAGPFKPAGDGSEAASRAEPFKRAFSISDHYSHFKVLLYVTSTSALTLFGHFEKKTK